MRYSPYIFGYLLSLIFSHTGYEQGKRGSKALLITATMITGAILLAFVTWFLILISSLGSGSPYKFPYNKKTVALKL